MYYKFHFGCFPDSPTKIVPFILSKVILKAHVCVVVYMVQQLTGI